jgi:FAD:protein FMN transferase
MLAFRSMNTEVRVTAVQGDEERIASMTARTFWDAECRFSRFRPDSELAKLNRARETMVVSRDLFDALARARAYTEMTDGLFEPGIGADLMALGYNRSFAPGALDREQAEPPRRRGRFLDLVLDRSTRSVTRPDDLQIDLGGMIKGATVDKSAQSLEGSGAIDAGGDAALRGQAPGGGPWLVDVEDPSDAWRTMATLALSDRAVATSAANRRRWRVGESFAHHLVDPRTRRPAVTDVLQATVVAATAELADVLAKVSFLLGSAQARQFLEKQPGVGAVLVRCAGDLVVVGDLDLRETTGD